RAPTRALMAALLPCPACSPSATTTQRRTTTSLSSAALIRAGTAFAAGPPARRRAADLRVSVSPSCNALIHSSIVLSVREGGGLAVWAAGPCVVVPSVTAKARQTVIGLVMIPPGCTGETRERGVCLKML